MKYLNFVTSNENKFRECAEVLPIPVKQVKVELLEIQAKTLKEVANIKITDAREKNIETPLFIEDAGFFVKALKGFPGVYSSYVHSTIGNQGILNLLKGVEDRSAHFECIIVYLKAPEKAPRVFTGAVHGKVSQEIRGTKGFGFDPIFLPSANPTTTFGEMETEEKNKISHRARALKKFVNHLKMQLDD
ncbi:MAG: XTP/dITP diphosphatase [Candidatus Hermodarchaeota archaeon]